MKTKIIIAILALTTAASVVALPVHRRGIQVCDRSLEVAELRANADWCDWYREYWIYSERETGYWLGMARAYREAADLIESGRLSSYALISERIEP